MASASDFCLHPDSIEEVMEDLINSNIICKGKIAELKDDTQQNFDHCLWMDVRQKEIKKESLVEMGINKNQSQSQFKRIKSEECPVKTLTNIKDLKIIDKEIAKTRRNLEVFQNQLAKKNALLANSILNLEKEEEQITSSPVVFNLDEDVAKHYFNLHLDHLEDTKGLCKGKKKTWKPFETKPPTVINVVTTLKVVNVDQTSMKNKEKELELMAMFDLKPIQVMGRTMEVPTSELPKTKPEIMSIVPNNSPSPYITDLSICEYDKSPNLNNNKNILQTVLQNWRLFVQKKIALKLEEKKHMDLNLMKHYFNLWVLYVEHRKSNKLKADTETCATANTTSDVNQTKIISIGIHSDSKITPKSPKNGCTKNDLSKIPPFIASNKIKQPESKLKPTLNNPEISKVNVSFVKPEDVYLKKKNNEQKCLSNKVITVGNISTSRTVLPKMVINKFENRCAHQQNVIQEQLALIEKQKQIIIDLKAENFATKSKLSLKSTATEVAKAHTTFEKKHRPSIKNLQSECRAALKQLEKPIEVKFKTRADALMESWNKRQEYCKQLHESTKLRKKRIEESMEKEKMELEERERNREKDKKRMNLLLMKVQQQLDQEKNNILLAAKLHTAKLNNIAQKHYDMKLQTRVFRVLKRNHLDAYSKAYYCTQFYERKLMKRAFVEWNLETKLSVQSKIQLSYKFYSTKLLERCLTNWHRQYREYKLKVQVSEDMFCLKLQERMFRRWAKYTAEQYLQYCCKTELAERLHRKQLLRRSFACWRDFPRVMFAEREKEQRRRAWRQAVQELVPDFSPVFAEQLEV